MGEQRRRRDGVERVVEKRLFRVCLNLLHSNPNRPSNFVFLKFDFEFNCEGFCLVFENKGFYTLLFSHLFMLTSNFLPLPMRCLTKKGVTWINYRGNVNLSPIYCWPKIRSYLKIVIIQESLFTLFLIEYIK